ncbi:MarR family winged helix-turn-helix transcriptional regulator [Phenylobacterium sp.]|uniref:MarR family winged helix-turn-helix transcriptional regulator n=1 Tax=Phenylobacterium sp. TaxID=1871053 RepID=UPI003D26A84E
MHWTDRLHRALIGISDRVNRLDLDARLLASSGVQLDRALFPLLSRLALNPDFNVAELANLVGRDHSTVSRQIVRLEQLGLLTRRSDPSDQRSRQLTLTVAGRNLLAQVAAVRRRKMEEHFADWNEADRDRLIELMNAMLDREPELSINRD